MRDAIALNTSNTRQVIITAVSSLLLLSAAVYYYLFRQGVGLYALFGIDSHHSMPLLSDIAGAFPSFVHTFVFGLLLWLAVGRVHENLCVGFWLVVNVIFECGQYLISVDSDVTQNVVYRYLQLGTFSWFDIAALVLGALCAVVAIKWIRGERSA